MLGTPGYRASRMAQALGSTSDSHSVSVLSTMPSPNPSPSYPEQREPTERVIPPTVVQYRRYRSSTPMIAGSQSHEQPA